MYGGLKHKLSYDLHEGLLLFSAPLGDWTEVLRGQLPRTAEVLGSVVARGTVLDAVGIGYPTLMGISDTARERFERSRLTGWSSRPLNIRGWDGPPYHLLEVLGRCGSIAFDRAVPLPPIGSFQRATGVFLDPGAHQAEDFVVPENYGMVLCSERVRDTVEREGLTGFTFESLDDLVFFAPTDNRGPAAADWGGLP